jgi:hypothetical protein
MPLPDSWPEAVRAAVGRVVGEVRGTARLSGLSGREVRRVDGDRGRVVVKGRAHRRELAFYTDVAHRLVGVSTPRLHWAGEVDGSAWLVLEHLPEPAPRDLPGAAYDVLVAVHTSRAAYGGLSEPFRPRWSDAMTRTAQQRTGLDLALLQQETAALLDGDTPISGDPNPRNWAWAEDGRLVLFDWERAGLATPGVDVAITLPGLPTAAQAEAGGAAYQRAGGRPDASLRPGALMLLKLWTAVELLAEDRDDGDLRGTQQWLAEALPDWVRSWA